jgi:Protein of unknown function, DUF481
MGNSAWGRELKLPKLLVHIPRLIVEDKHIMKIRTFIISTIFLFAAPLYAREKTDVLVMNNGDRLTGEIKGLDAGILYVSFDYILGTSSVNWSKVHHLESKQEFIVKAEDGSVYSGTLKTAEYTGGDRPIKIEISETPEKTEVVEQSHIVSVDQISDRFWQRFNGSISSGFTYSKGNQSTQYNLGSSIEYPRERWSSGANYSSTLASNAGAAVSTRNSLTLNYLHLLRRNNWYYSGLAGFRQSSEQEIDLQTNLGGGVGRYLKNTNRAKIYVTGGLGWQNTKYSQSLALQGSQNVAGVLLNAQVNFFSFNKTNLTLTGTAFPALSNPGRVFFNTNATYFIKFGNLTWNISFYGNWDNQPPRNFSGSDYGTSSGLGWTFGNK